MYNRSYETYEVKSHKNCTIVKILVEDGQLVKKGDKLFSVK